MPSAACCPCGQLAGCVCGGVACGTVCERRAGTAQLCGFEEFIDPTTPPKFYKRRRTSGPMTTARYLDPGCGGVIVVPASLECRSKAGSATLIGISEYVAPSTPPKKYRSNGASGTRSTQTGIGCGGALTVNTWSGAITYSPTTGIMISDTRCHQINGGPCNPVIGPAPQHVPRSNWGNAANDPNVGCGGPPTTRYATAAPTESHDIGRGLCVDCGAGGFNKDAGDGIGNLSDEDTEADAVARAVAAIGSWSVPGLCSANTSFQVARVNFTFNFRFAQTRLVITSGLVAGRSYIGKIFVGVRNQGSVGPFVDTGSPIQVNFTASGPAYTSDWQDLPNQQGKEHAATGLEVLGGLEEMVQDNWDVDENYGPNLPAICAPVAVDNSTRTIDGGPVAWPFEGVVPPDAYASQAVQVTSQTERISVGTDVCAINVGTGFYEKVSGNVLESLSEEDTEEDAINRALGGAPWLPCLAGCAVAGCSAFQTQRGAGESVFGFAQVRTKATFPATIGVSYLVTIRYAARVLGTSGPFLFYALTEVVVVADAVSEETGWFDVPTEPGMEVIVANCSVEALP